jgi:flavin reductase (DIM6/NTAB) family NADH-FMN oxidoreductase RutF
MLAGDHSEQVDIGAPTTARVEQETAQDGFVQQEKGIRMMNATITTTPTIPSPSPSFDQHDFRSACGSFVTGITVVAAASAEGANGSTVNSFTSLSTDPPQVVVCLALNTRTLQHVQSSGRFSVNILSSEQTEIARIFASKTPDKISQVDWTRGANGAPLIDGAVTSFECDVVTMQREATHTSLVHDSEAAPLVFFRSTISAGHALQAQH